MGDWYDPEIEPIPFGCTLLIFAALAVAVVITIASFLL